jgi:hypothetical protein
MPDARAVAGIRWEPIKAPTPKHMRFQYQAYQAAMRLT